jgi:uncharacterized protein YjbI with pentapeptide repeats
MRRPRVVLGPVLAACLVASSAVVVAAPSYAFGVGCPTVAADGAVTPAPTHAISWAQCDLSGADLSGADLGSANLAYSDLSGADLTGTDLTGANLVHTHWTGATVVGAQLAGALMLAPVSSGMTGAPATLPTAYRVAGGAFLGPAAVVVGADLAGVDLAGVNLAEATLSKVTLTGATLTAAVLSHSSLTEVALEGADLTGATLDGVRGRRLTGAPVLPAGWSQTSGYLVGPGASLGGAVLDGVDLRGRSLADADLRAASLVGVDLTGSDLARANLGYAVLRKAKLAGATLAGATLTRVSSGGLVGAPTLPVGWIAAKGWLVGPTADLSLADLAGADLRAASLQQSLLYRADLTRADLTGVDLSNSYLGGTDADGVILKGADLSGIQVDSVLMMNADLRGATMRWISSYWWTLYGSDLTGATGLETGSYDLQSWDDVRCPDGRVGQHHRGSSCLQGLDVVAPRLAVTPIPTTFSPTHPTRLRATARATDESSTAQVRFRWRLLKVAGTSYSPYRYSDSWMESYADQAPPGQDIHWDDDMSSVCVQAQARDQAGNATPWSPERCTLVIQADSAFAAAGGFTLVRASNGWSGRRYAKATRKGATLTHPSSTYVRQVGLVASTCPTCGSVAVYVGSTRIGSVSLKRSTTTMRQAIVLPRLPSRVRGKVRIVVTSTSRLVRIDGVFMSPV